MKSNSGVDPSCCSKGGETWLSSDSSVVVEPQVLLIDWVGEQEEEESGMVPCLWTESWEDGTVPN